MIIPSRWAVGEPMIEWCKEHDLQAHRVLEDGFSCVRDGEFAPGHARYHVRATEMYPPGEPVVMDQVGDDVVMREAGEDGVMVERVLWVEEPPPLNPEWVEMFGEGAAWV